MRELGLLQTWKYYQPLNRGHSSICAAGAARGINSHLHLLFLVVVGLTFSALIVFCTSSVREMAAPKFTSARGSH